MLRSTRRNLLVLGRKAYSDFSYKKHEGSEPLKNISYGQALEEASQKYPQRLAIISRPQNSSVTYSDLLVKSDRFAAGLKCLGLQTGDCVGVWAPNMIEWLVANLACARAGFIVAALNPAYQASELKYCINKVGIKTLICPKRVDKNDYITTLKKIVPNLESLQAENLKCNEVPSLKNVVIVLEEASLRGTFGYNQVMGFASENEISSIKNSQNSLNPDLPLNIQFTSGTTGLPKAAVINHHSLVNNAYFLGKRNGFHLKHHKICVQVPFFHAFGYTITMAASISHGATLVVPSHSYNSLENLRAIHEEKCSVIHGTPTMYIDLVSMQKRHRLDISPEFAVAGGSPCPPELFKNMQSVLNLQKVKSVYGLSETTAVVFQSLPEEDELKATETVGHLAEHVEAKVVDESGNVVPLGKPGELWTRGYTTMMGYWNDEQKTKETITEDGWLKTGDQFVLEKDGYGRIVGRLKDMIIRGGENIYPKEVEDFVITHPDVVDVQVIGLPHERLGEEVCACIKVRKGTSPNREDIKKFCEGKLAHFKIPSRVEIFENFPTTQSGKIQKYRLKEEILQKPTPLN